MGDTGRALGGGEISAFEGSFSHDDIQYRVRSIVGAAGIDASAVAVSKGDGSATGAPATPVAPGLMSGPVIPTHETDPDVPTALAAPTATVTKSTKTTGTK